MRILVIGGVWADPALQWTSLRRAFARVLPTAVVVVEAESWCHPWEIRRIRSFIKRLADTYDDGEETIIIGHSMGGVIACAAAPYFKRSVIRGIVTLHSPHRFLGGIFSRLFRARDVQVPIVSYQGLYDGLVWCGTRHPKAVIHVRHRSNHLHDLLDWQHNADDIANTAVRVFLNQQTVE